MIRELINIAIALALGLLTGFYFEHRSTVAARNRSDELQLHSDQLQYELDSLRHSIYSMGGQEPKLRTPANVDLRQLVLRRALDTQNADGRVHVDLLRSHFGGRGEDVRAIDKAISEICDDGQARLSGRWLEVS